MYVCLRHPYIHKSSLSETYIHTWNIHTRSAHNIHTRSVAWDIHTYLLRSLRHTYIHAQLPGTYIHTYMLRRPQTYIHTCLGLSDVHTYMLRVGLELKHTYIHVWRLARLLEVPPLTNLKKLNWWSNTERFSWGIWHPPKQADFVGLRETYRHTCSGASDIHTYMLRVRLELKHTYIHVWSLAGLWEVPSLTIQKKY